MSNVEVTVDTTALEPYAAQIQEAFGSMGELFRQFLDDRAIPPLQSEAGSQRNVITGRYMNDWEAEVEDPVSAIVKTDATYWIFLEYGTRKIKAKPVVQEVVQAMVGDLGPFITDALSIAMQQAGR
jgi:hypothetical protein